MFGRRKTILRIYAAVFAAVTLLAGFLLCRSAVRLYRTGYASENLTENGARIRAAFGAETVSEAFREIAWSIWLWFGLALTGIVFRFRLPEQKPKPESMKPLLQPRRRTALRIALLVCTAGLIVCGICDGGMRAMFAKAVAVCSECIGLG